MKKILTLITISVWVACVFVSCAARLPEGMSEDSVKQFGESIINHLNEKDYEAILELSDDAVSQALAQSPLADAWEPFFEELGKYEKIEKIALTSQNELAIYVAQVKYANASATFTISLDKDYRLSGLFFK